MFSTDPISYIVQNLRVADLIELDECGHTSVQAEALFRLPGVDVTLFQSPKTHKPAAIMGFYAMTPVALSAAMLCTDDWPHVARLVFRTGLKAVRPRLLQKGYKRAECRVMEGHDDAVRLLEHLGFRQEARLPHYGKTGRAFLQYAWNAGDHSTL